VRPSTTLGMSGVEDCSSPNPLIPSVVEGRTALVQDLKA
jgi:hypothetical protein